MSGRDWTMLPWREKTRSERIQTVAADALACVVGLGMFIGILIVIGESLDGVSRYNSEHNRCLQRATNGYDTQQCH